MIERLAHALPFRFFFLNATTKVGETGLTVLVSVFAPDGTEIITGGAASEVDLGLYEYTLSASYVTSYGVYTAVAATTSAAVVAKAAVDVRWVPDWVERTAAILDVTETPDSSGVVDTLAGLRAIQRRRLNDLDGGKYMTHEVDSALSRAYEETVCLARCHRLKLEIGRSRPYSAIATYYPISRITTAPVSGGHSYVLHETATIAGVEGGGVLATVEVVAVSAGAVTAVRLLDGGTGYDINDLGTKGTAAAGVGVGLTVRVEALAEVFEAGKSIYDVNPIFEPFEVRIGTRPLTKVAAASLAVSDPRWDHIADGTPTKWAHLSGGTILIWPPPSLAATMGIGDVESTPDAAGTGYAVGDILTLTAVGASGGQVEVLAVGTAGAVTRIGLYASGEGYDLGNYSNVIFNTTGGGGSGCRVKVLGFCYGKLRVYGYAAPAALMAEDDRPVALPVGYRIAPIADRAESDLRATRPTLAGNVEMSGRLLQRWYAWVEKLTTREA
jgi:hypothetical protein